jgi:CubicO group peptidase (beta-lactamase class C family)
MKSLLFCLTLFVVTYPVISRAASENQAMGEQVAQHLSAFRGGPAVSVLISHKAEILFHGVEGLANVELTVPANKDMAWAIGSISKQFTAAAILLLEEQGKLKTSDRVADHIDLIEEPEAKAITILHLLTHTSGLTDILRDPSLVDVYARPFTNVERLAYVVKTMDLSTEPGTEYEYSNTNYVLLAHIVERASGLTYEAFLQRHIFTPLKMNNTFVGNPGLIQPRKVSGYNPFNYQSPDGTLAPAYYLPFDLLWAKGAGDLYSTTGDLATWLSSLASNKLLSAASTEKMLARYKFKDGSYSKNAYGFRQQQIGKHQFFTKSGMINGFQSNLIWIPEEQLILIGLSARLDKSPRFVHELAEYLLRP